MDINIFVAVMLAAVLHSAWNGMVKKHEDKVISVSAIVFEHADSIYCYAIYAFANFRKCALYNFKCNNSPRLSNLFNICL